jgi:hypothetical protein
MFIVETKHDGGLKPFAHCIGFAFLIAAVGVIASKC